MPDLASPVLRAWETGGVGWNVTALGGPPHITEMASCLPRHWRVEVELAAYLGEVTCRTEGASDENPNCMIRNSWRMLRN